MNKTIKTGRLERTYQFDRALVNEENRTIDLSFSSEEPVDRWFGKEILGHDKGNVNLKRLKSGAPLLVNHYGDQIGVVEKAWVDGESKKGRAVVRFSKSQRGEEIYQDVLDGIRQNVSVGYVIDELVLVKEDKKAGNTYRATKWTPLEVSIVSVPADITVGVGREDDKREHTTVIRNLKEEKMEEKVKQEVRQEQPKIEVDTDKIKRDARKAELQRISEIRAIGDKFNQKDLADKFIEEDKTVDEFRMAVLEAIGKAKPVRQSPEIGMTEKEKKEYSFLRLLAALSKPEDQNLREKAAFEFECSREAEKLYGRTAKGAMIPFDVLTGQRAGMVVGTAAQGGNLVATDLLSASFIEMLRNAMVVRKLGATILSGLQGNIAIPKQTGGATAYWLAENDDVTESDQTITQVALTPKTVAAYTNYSRKLFLQSSISIENFIRGDLAKTLALAIDLAAINGSGSSNQPTGILNTSGIGAVEGGTDGAVPTWGNIVDLETEVAIDNADIGSLAYLTNAKVRGKLKQTPRVSGYPDYIWDKGDTPLNGYRTEVSNQVPSNLTKGTSTGVCSAIIFGNWADLLIGEWSGLDITVDPYSLSTKGAVKVIVFQDVDIAVRHAESFAAMQDALTA